MKKLTVMMIILFASACADSARIKIDPAYEHANLDKQSAAYVSIPADGRYESDVYSGSGQTVSTVIRAALLKHMAQVDEATAVQSYQEALESAKEKNYRYLFFPTILHWEDRATEWSGIPDKAQIKVVVVDVRNDKTLSTVIIDGSSGLATFGGDHPQDLLPEPVGEYVDSLF